MVPEAIKQEILTFYYINIHARLKHSYTTLVQDVNTWGNLEEDEGHQGKKFSLCLFSINLHLLKNGQIIFKKD